MDYLLMSRLCCPCCRNAFEHGAFRDKGLYDGALRCEGCGRSFPVRAGVPDLLTGAIPDDAEWQQWHSHLEAFQARREARRHQTRSLTKYLPGKGRSDQEAFARFAGITSGAVLDVGCGPGKFRHRLPEAVDYAGIDPIPLAEAGSFPFARALAERIPFLDETFDHVTVLAALDHFKDLPRFLAEARRVLKPGGRLHVLQQVHERRSIVRSLAHTVKDTLEDRNTGTHNHETPHHMHDFAHSDLQNVLVDEFQVTREQEYSPRWYVPRRLFLTLRPRTPDFAPQGR